MFFISGEDLEAGAGEVGGKGGEACLATLLVFVHDREPYFGNKVRDGRVGGAWVSQGEAMSENEAAEGGVVFEELSAVRSKFAELRRVVQGGEGKSLGNPNRKACQQASRNGLDPSM